MTDLYYIEFQLMPYAYTKKTNFKPSSDIKVLTPADIKRLTKNG